jgi:tripartite-type tricarboxylate transporter receptor subunit TctC
VDALHVPYWGSAPFITDLLGGQIDCAFETMTAAAPHVKGGKLVAIAQTRGQRAKAFPEVPTMAELGCAGFEASTWYGLVGPARLPTPAQKKLNADVNKVLALPDVQERLDSLGAEGAGGSSDKFAQFIRGENLKWARVVKDGGIQIDG